MIKINYCHPLWFVKCGFMVTRCPWYHANEGRSQSPSIRAESWIIVNLVRRCHPSIIARRFSCLRTTTRLGLAHDIIQLCSQWFMLLMREGSKRGKKDLKFKGWKKCPVVFLKLFMSISNIKSVLGQSTTTLMFGPQILIQPASQLQIQTHNLGKSFTCHHTAE